MRKGKFAQAAQIPRDSSTNSHESGETGREWPLKGMRRHGKPQRKISSQLVINSDHCSAEDSRGRQNHVWQNRAKDLEVAEGTTGWWSLTFRGLSKTFVMATEPASVFEPGRSSA